MAQPIATVEIARKPGPWGGYVVREITAGGRVVNSWPYAKIEATEARLYAKRLARKHSATLSSKL